jgi:hypothetical protein
MMIRNRVFLKTVSIFLLISFVNGIFFPTISLALTSGPTQPEFEGYEEVGSTDMVNLLTGDFNYNIPVLDVPGPEGGFSMPLAYHSGISTQQDASWVGLGWSLNPGAITRSVSQYPDDFSGEVLSTHVADPGGSGYSINFIVGSFNHDSKEGNGGTIGIEGLLSGGWGTRSDHASLLGVNFDGGKAKVDPVAVTMLALTVATAGMTSAGGALASEAESVNLAMDIANYEQLGVGIASSVGKSSESINDWSITSKNYFFYSKYNYYLDDTKSENMYGSLYFGNNTLSNNYGNFFKGVSDMYMQINDKNTGTVITPSNIASDNYSVKGPGITGSIKPYHYETGSLAFYKVLSSSELMYDKFPFLNTYKVKYKYDGDYSNYYNYHSYNNNSDIGITLNANSTATNAKYDVQDLSLNTSSIRTSPERRGFKNNKLIQGRNIEWFSNSEIDNASQTGVFIDFLNQVSRTAFRSSLPQKGVGGYAVTRADGMTYYYALPVYNIYQRSHSQDASDGTKYNQSEISDDFAYQWLLTGITGPDFVDRGEIGVIDAQDWGYYVTLDYGKFSSQYKWRSPYIGISSGSSIYSIPSDDGNSRQFIEGTKETYYLDKISTRTHTAIFVKDVRNDGRGYYFPSDGISFGTSPLTTECPSSSLKLNEIILLKNEDFQTLTSLSKSAGNNNNTVANNDNLNNVYDVSDLNTTLSVINQKQLKKIVFNYSYQLCPGTPNSFASATTPPRDVQTINIPNNNNHYYIYYIDPTHATGKLTLTGIDIKGPNDASLLPSYVFGYNGANPPYHPDHWDGWGMYASNGSFAYNGHNCHGTDGIAWNLTDITTPLGGTISVTYERDSYSSVSGDAILTKLNITDFDPNTNRVTFDIRPLAGKSLTDYLTNGSTVTIDWHAWQDQYCYGGITGTFPWPLTISNSQTVSQLQSNSFAITTPNYNPESCSLYILKCIVGCSAGVYSNGSATGSITVTEASKLGGDVRVSQIKVSDGSNIYKTNYVYTQDGTPAGLSSGVVAQEPEYIKTSSYPFDAIANAVTDYPNTPVMYKKVTVYNGKLSDATDFVTGTEYHFTTPDASMIVFPGTQVLSDIYYGNYDGSGANAISRVGNNAVKIFTSKIGSLESISTFDKSGLTLSQSILKYSTDPSGQGYGAFTEGSTVSELQTEYVDPAKYYHQTNNYWKLERTTKAYYPNFLQSITTINNNVKNEVENTSFDFFTAEPLEKSFTNSLGIKYISVNLPAYHAYQEMGPKADNTANKNMMSQKAASYLFKGYEGEFKNISADITAIGSEFGVTKYQIVLKNGEKFPPNYGVSFGPWLREIGYPWVEEVEYISPDRTTAYVHTDQNIAGTNQVQLYYDPMISANIQTWDNDWNYRTINNINTYENTSITNSIAKIWRKKSNYVWQSPQLNSDGSYQNFVGFDWTKNATNNFNWKKVSEVVNYDQYSKTLEIKDINSNYSSTKYGYAINGSPLNSVLPISSAINSKYTEQAYSGAEKFNYDGTFQFDGEVSFWGASPVTTSISDPVPHTGNYSLKINNNGVGFIYQAKIEAGGIETGKTYRASVWINDNGNTTAGLYYHLKDPNGIIVSTPNAGSVNLSTATNIIKCGNWKLLNLDIPLTGSYNNYYLVVGCQNFSNTTPAYFDDFRFHPLNASMKSFVYDESKGLLTHVLDKDNFYVRYAYDVQGRVIGVYKETIKGEIKTTQYDYNWSH